VAEEAEATSLGTFKPAAPVVVVACTAAPAQLELLAKETVGVTVPSTIPQLVVVVLEVPEATELALKWQMLSVGPAVLE
jgi:hypothetical protein